MILCLEKVDAKNKILIIQGTTIPFMSLDSLDGESELYRLLIDNSLQGLLILQDEHVIFANKAVAEISGYTQ